jgi:hypothetical protein
MARWYGPQPGQLFAGLLLSFAVTLIAVVWAPRLALASCAVVMVLCGLFCAEVQPRPPLSTPLSRIAESTPTPTPATRRLGILTGHRVEGTIVRTTAMRLIDSFAPYSETPRREQSQQVDLRVESVDGAPLSRPEGLRLTLYAPAEARFPALLCGGTLDGTVEMHTQERFLDPGVWDGTAWLHQQGIVVLGSGHLAGVQVTTSRGNQGFSCRLHAVQQAASERLIQFVDQQQARGMPRVLRLSPGNNDSLVLQFGYGSTTALLEGDAERPSEERMLARGGLRSDFLKIGHHGSRSSTSAQFLSAVRPSCAALSVGRRNFYGHPRREVLEELQEAHVLTWRTDMLGLSTFYLDGHSVASDVWAAR